MANPISVRQLVCLQSMWARRMRTRGIAAADSRELRHEYIAAATDGRARGTKELSFADAKRVLRLLFAEQGSKTMTIADAAAARAAGTHGRKAHYDASGVMLAGEQQFALLATLRHAIGWDQARLDVFVARQLGGAAIRTMADANRVIWAIKSMMRRQVTENKGVK